MATTHRTWSSRQPWSAVGSLWDWMVSRTHPDWMIRFSQEDHELRVLTHSDELNRIYSEDVGPPVNRDANRASRSENVTQEVGILPQNAPNLIGSTNRGWLERPAFKETRATVASAGPRTIVLTSAAPPADVLRLKNTCGKEQRSEEADGEARRPHIRPERRHGGDTEKERGGDTHQEGEGMAAEEEGARSPTITAWEAGWNVTNAIQGVFVLGLPFALAQSGYAGLVLLVVSAWVCNHTGKILVACLYEEELSEGYYSGSKVRVRHSYQDIVEACCKGLWPSWPRLGGWMVNVAQVVELLMTCTLYLVVSTSLLSVSLSGDAVPRSACSLVSLLFLMPCLLLTDLRPVSTLSLLCSLAHILISLLVMLYCLSRASSWSWSHLSLSADPQDFLVSVGVIIFSYTSQIFLPPLEGSMEDKGQFAAMLAWTHGAACIMKTSFSVLAVLTWGSETSEVITDNLPSDLRPLVNLCLLAKALLSYPLPFYSAAEILQGCLLADSAPAAATAPLKGGGRSLSLQTVLVRTTLLLASYLLALLVPRFSLLMGLTGSVTGAAMTLILPCLCHLRLQGGTLSRGERLLDAGILSVGVVCSVSGVICSVKRLVEEL